MRRGRDGGMEEGRLRWIIETQERLTLWKDGER